MPKEKTGFTRGNNVKDTCSTAATILDVKSKTRDQLLTMRRVNPIEAENAGKGPARFETSASTAHNAAALAPMGTYSVFSSFAGVDLIVPRSHRRVRP